MDVLIISPLLPISNKSHGNIFVYQQAKKLAERGHTIWAIAAHTETREEGNLKIINRPESKFKMIHLAVNALFKFPRKSFKLLNAMGLRRTIGYLSLVELADRIVKKNNIDIVDGEFIGTGGIIAYFLGIPYIVIEHGIFSEGLMNNCISTKEIEFSKKVLEKAQIIVVPSQYLAKCISQFTEKRIAVLHNGVDLSLFRPRKNDLFKKPTFLSMGTLNKRKNHIDSLQAFKILVNKKFDVNLLIIGMGHEKRALEYYVKQNELSQRVIFLEYVTDEERQAYYSSAFAFVLPTLYEAFGIVFLESMACGCPVISNRVCAVPEVVGGGGLLVEPKNIHELAEAMERLLDDRQLRDKLIKNALMQARKFSIEERIDALEKIYSEAIIT